MSDNWVVQNLENALNTWNEKLAEIWQLITQSPETFKGGVIWKVIVDVHGALQPLVVEAVKELVSDAYFAKEIEKRIGVQTDTSVVDKELANYENKLKEVDLNKARLENEIDNLPVDARFRERKIHDMTLRLDALYDMMVELEERIEDAKLRKSSIEM